MVVSTATERREVGFGICTLPQEQPVWIQGPWVANGTYANGVLVLDTASRQIESIPLSSSPHIVPDWAERREIPRPTAHAAGVVGRIL